MMDYFCYYFYLRITNLKIFSIMNKSLLKFTLATVCVIIGSASVGFAEAKANRNTTIQTKFTDEFFQNWQNNGIPRFCE